MTVQEAVNKVVALAESQVGYTPYSGKRTKYADYLDSLGFIYNGKKSGYDWCDVFYDWLIISTFGADTGIKMIYQPKYSTGAGCGYSANFYRQNKAFTSIPQKGAQIFYAPSGNESHTGIVVDVDSDYVYTVEGNIGGGNGRVGRKTIRRNSGSISGYGIPDWKLVTTESPSKVFGIDISGWQGNYPLDKAQKEGVKFAILKGGGADTGYCYKDNKFERNYENAKKLKMPVGAYWFSYAFNKGQAEKEAEYFYQNCLKGKQFELPIYLDVENKTQLNIGKRALTDVVKAWLDYLEKKDYWVGIYSSLSYFNNYLYDNELQKYAHWVAQWSTKLSKDCGMWQFGGETNYIRSNKVAGIVTDQNYMLFDYEKAIKEKGLNGFPKQKPQIGFTRISGTNRYQTAIEVAKKKGSKFDAVVIASGDDYPDALSASYLASQHNAPIVLVNEATMKEVAAYVKSVTKKAFIIGGKGAVSSEMEKLLKGVEVERISGKNRYDTNLKLLERSNSDTLIVCDGRKYADAIVSSATRYPIMITGEKLTEGQREFLKNRTIKNLYMVGGSVSSEVKKELKNAKKIIGKNRYETARLVANTFYPKSDKVILVTGQNFADGLCGSQLAVAPILLADKKYYTDAQMYCKAVKPKKCFVIGGKGAISDTTINWVLTW